MTAPEWALPKKTIWVGEAPWRTAYSSDH